MSGWLRWRFERLPDPFGWEICNSERSRSGGCRDRDGPLFFGVLVVSPAHAPPPLLPPIDTGGNCSSWNEARSTGSILARSTRWSPPYLHPPLGTSCHGENTLSPLYLVVTFLRVHSVPLPGLSGSGSRGQRLVFNVPPPLGQPRGPVRRRTPPWRPVGGAKPNI